MPPLDVAEALGISPGSSDFRVLLSSSIKYGLTSGSYNSDRVKIEPLGQTIVSPKSAEEAAKAKLDAFLSCPTFRQIFDHFRGKKLAEQTFFENTVAREFAVPKEHASACVSVFLKNAEYLEIIRNLKTGKWLGGTVNENGGVEVSETFNDESAETSIPPLLETPEDVVNRVVGVTERVQDEAAKTIIENKRVFISHGKSREIVDQIKELLTYGKFIPVVSVDRNTTSIPVPEKVFEDMRSCSAGIIHVMSEGVLMDPDGKEVTRINENVLIEVGAAIALYRKKFILLVQKGVKLPSNLQGLYRCEYEGEKLDYDSTMKLLKTFTQFSAEDSL